LHCAIYEPGALVLLVSPSQRQSRELFAKTTGFLKAIEPVVELEEDNRPSATLAQQEPHHQLARRQSDGAGLQRAAVSGC
jgi:hypothetical protein